MRLFQPREKEQLALYYTPGLYYYLMPVKMDLSGLLKSINEEMQSTKEEPATVNAELQSNVTDRTGRCEGTLS